jgi:hypothetical protein
MSANKKRGVGGGVGGVMVAREGGGSAPAVAATELLADGSYL